jgi:hypothetical protein
MGNLLSDQCQPNLNHWHAPCPATLPGSLTSGIGQARDLYAVRAVALRLTFAGPSKVLGENRAEIAPEKDEQQTPK